MEKKILQFVIASCLFLPSVNLALLYISILIIYLIQIHKIDRASLSIIIYLIILSLVRFLITFNVVEFNEAIKIFAILIFIISISSITRYSNTIYKIIYFFVVINFIFTLLQFIKINLAGLIYPITEIYTTNTHYEMLSVNSVRAIGLMGGPAQNGVLGFTIFLYSVLGNKNNYILTIVSLITIFLSQSKTVILGLIIVSITILIYKTLKFKFKYICLSVIFLSFIVLFMPKLEIADNFREISLLINYTGGSFSSFDARLTKWHDMLAVSFESIFYIIFGVGRSILESNNVKSSVYDSDLMYLYINFGLIGLLGTLFFIYYCIHINPTRVKYFLAAFLPLIFTINVFFDFKIMMTILLIINLLKYEKNILGAYKL